MKNKNASEPPVGWPPRHLDDSLGFNLDRVAQLFRLELLRALSEYSLTPEQLRILALLRSRGPMNQQHIVAGTMSDKPTTSRMLDRLVREGWVERKNDPDDRRATIIQLTGKARRNWTRVAELLDAHFAFAGEVLTREEQKKLASYLKRLRLYLDRQQKRE